MKIKNVIDGWKHVLVEDKAIEEMAAKRLQICSECPNKTRLMDIVDVCGLCHCPLLAKIRSIDENCPLSKWT